MPTRVVSFKQPAATLNRQENGHFIQIFQKIELFMCVIGVPFDALNIRSKIMIRWSFSFGLAIFCLNLTIQILSIVINIKPKTTTEWNYLVSDINFSVSMIMTHLALFIFTPPKWKKMLPILLEIEELHIFEQDDYKKFKKLLTRAKVLFIVMVRISEKATYFQVLIY